MLPLETISFVPEHVLLSLVRKQSYLTYLTTEICRYPSGMDTRNLRAQRAEIASQITHITTEFDLRPTFPAATILEGRSEKVRRQKKNAWDYHAAMAMQRHEEAALYRDETLKKRATMEEARAIFVCRLIQRDLTE